MKKFILLSLLLLSISTTKKEDILGYWELYKIEKLTINKIKEKRTKFIKFYEDGKLEGGRVGENDVQNSGRWEIKGNVLNIISETSDSGEYLIESLTKDKLVLFKDSIRIFLDRGVQ